MFKRKRSFKRSHGAKRFKKGGKSGWSYRSQGDTSASGYRHTNARRSLAVLPRSFNVPDAIRVKVKTAVSAIFTSTAGAAFTAAVVPNNLGQPFAAFGSAHVSPTADNFCTLYQRYLVLGARLTCKWYPPVAANNTVGGSSAIAAQTVNTVSTSAFTGAADFEEADLTTGFRPLPLITGWGGQKMYQSLYMDMAKVIGCSRPEYAANAAGVLNATGSVWDPPQSTSANGIVLPIFQVYYQSADGTTTSTYGCDFILTQYVEFSQRRRS